MKWQMLESSEFLVAFPPFAVVIIWEREKKLHDREKRQYYILVRLSHQDIPAQTRKNEITFLINIHDYF